MLNGINNNQDNLIGNQIGQQNGVSRISSGLVSNPYQQVDRNLLIDESSISDIALKLFEREGDIKKFAQLAMSDSDDDSQNTIVAELFKKGIVDPYDETGISALSSNEQLLKDLEL